MMPETMLGAMPGASAQASNGDARSNARYATLQTQLTQRLQDNQKSSCVLNAPDPVHNPYSARSEYIELPSDAALTAFLAALTPSRVLRDRERTFSREERKRQTFLRQKSATERAQRRQEEIALAIEMANEMRKKP